MDVTNVSEWCKKNNMILNENKTKCILIGTSQRLSRCQSNLEITVNNHKIECSKYEQFLGMQIDKSLSLSNILTMYARILHLKYHYYVKFNNL